MELAPDIPISNNSSIKRLRGRVPPWGASFYLFHHYFFYTTQYGLRSKRS